MKQLNNAIEKYRNNEVTAWQAARIANIPLSQFMNILVKKRINFHYGLKEFGEDIEGLDY